MIARALISVYDKSGLEDFARGLAGLGAELVASGGTAAFLEEMEIGVTRIEELTEVPELLGGRVKTLHPAIHAGILARRDRDTEVAALDDHGIEPFDLVCVNFYPFGDGQPGDERALDLIDIGGPSMLRAAAKNYEHVVPVSAREQYETVLRELRCDGRVSGATRRRLAGKAFATTAEYEARIAAWFAEPAELPERLSTSFQKVRELVYGENPHQRAAYYSQSGATAHLLSGVVQLHGRELSLVNLYDLSMARALLAELREPACVIVKHANPCGAAVGRSVDEAFGAALACDPVSAFGMVCALNRGVGAALGERLAERFVDVLYAPSYVDGALAALRRKPATRILAGPESLPRAQWEVKGVPGGVLVQEPDVAEESASSMRVVCGSPSERTWSDLLFAWRVCKHVTSNAIVIARDGRTLGIGGGQASRVDAVRLAIEKAHDRGHDLAGAVLASDAFFPFADGPQLALEAGVTALIQPGGSKRDAEVSEAVERASAEMVFTGRRHFRH